MHAARTVAAAVLLAASGMASAQAPRDEGRHRHEGLFLQLDLGLGYMRSELDEPGLDLKQDGGAGEFSIAVGYNVIPGLIIGGQLWGVGAGDPDVEVNGVTAPSDDDTTIALGGIGLNVTYYFMPLNVYVQATPSIVTLTGERTGAEDLESDAGFGLRLAVGKEWWVSDSWAIGLNAQVAFASNDDDGPPAGTYDTRWFGVAFSATYD